MHMFMRRNAISRSQTPRVLHRRPYLIVCAAAKELEERAPWRWRKYRWLDQELCLYLSISKEEGVCGLPRSTSSPSLNRPPLKMEKRRGAAKIRVGRCWKLGHSLLTQWVGDPYDAVQIPWHYNLITRNIWCTKGTGTEIKKGMATCLHGNSKLICVWTRIDKSDVDEGSLYS